MTEQEAINNLKHIFSEFELDLPNIDSLETLHMAISALERQIPKKLFGNKHNPVIVGDTVSGLCPMCLTEFVCITPRLYAEKGLGYCKEYGQRLDWGDI